MLTGRAFHSLAVRIRNDEHWFIVPNAHRCGSCEKVSCVNNMSMEEYGQVTNTRTYNPHLFTNVHTTFFDIHDPIIFTPITLIT